MVLAAEVRNLGGALEGLSSQNVVKLLSAYVRAVARAVFQRGGTIERIAPDGLVACFANLGESSAPALEAAVELVQRFELVSDRLVAEGGRALHVAVGVHVGDVMVLNVGGERFMVRTVMGEATRTAEALREAAGPGEILVSPEVAAVASGVSLEPGHDVSVPGRSEAVRASRVLYALAPDLDDDPDTLVTGKS